MRIPPAVAVLLLTPGLTACGPLSAVGLIGSSVIKTIRNYNEAEAVEAPRRQAIAKTNLDLGVEYMRRGEYETALTRLERARHADPDYAPTYSVLGVLHQKLGEDELAESNFRKSLALDADDSDTFNNYGQFLCRQGRYAEAEEHFLKSAANPLYSSPETPYTNAGTCAYINKDIPKAVGYFKQALSSNPRIPAALISMSEIEYANQNYASANHYLERFLEVSTHSARSLLLGIRIKRQLGDADAIASYSLLLRNKFPDSEEAGRLYEHAVSEAALAMGQSGPMSQPPLLSDIELLASPRLLTDRQLLDESQN